MNVLRRSLLQGITATGALVATGSLRALAQSLAPPALDNSTIDYLERLPRLTDTALKSPANRPTIITFFATWCPPCRPEFEALNRLDREFRDTDLSIVAVNVFETLDGLSTNGSRRRFYGVTQPTFPILDGNVDATATFGGVTRIPTLLIYDRHGALYYHFVHATGATVQYVGYQEIKEQIQPLL